VDDFEYIIAVNRQPLVLFVPSDSPYKTLKDFVEDAKKKPGKISVAVSGIGTLLHLAISDLALRENLELNVVPIAKGAEIPAQVAAHHIDIGVHHPPNVGTFVEAGKVRMLCTFSEERLPYFPDLPTAIELGYDIEQEVWQFILAPKATPKEQLKWIHDTFKKTMEDPGFVSTCEKLKIDLGYRSGEDTYAGVVKASNVYKGIVDHLGLKTKK
jgi:tripartite-type tricarboxylate transporter receptor subunit TctC